MRKYLLPVLLILLCKGSLFASHIVGGEFELLHLEDFRYRLNMIMYFDEINGNPGAKDQSIVVFIWRKSDNTRLRDITLLTQEDFLVPYSNTDCDDGQLITARIVYSAEITLPEDEFSDPEGYYISWERCCRNYTITNIFSEDAASTGISAGQTFYLEFPPVTKNGEPFINSSPSLFPPLRDYGCVDKFYFVDFGGTDVDDDSLVYSLVTPYSTFDTKVAIPPVPNPGPYPPVVWRNGFDIENVLGGNPDLQISSKGLLTVTPGSTGLYVFAVKCEEYRDGVKIGEMRRDFQMLVVANCLNENPVIRARELGKGSFYVENETLDFAFTDTQKCVEILVNDIPVSGDSAENVTVRAIPINFDAELEGIDIDFGGNVPIVSETDTARFTVCFPDCPFLRDEPYKIGIIGFDDACPQPALDTVIITLNVQPPPNQFAYYAPNRGGTHYNSITRNVVQSAGGTLSIDINGYDDDFDSLTFEINPIGFELSDVGMAFTDPILVDGEFNTTFTWDYDCNAEDLDFSSGRDISSGGIIRKAYDIELILDDVDQCEFADPQILRMEMVISFPDQTVPRVFRQGQPTVDEMVLTYEVNQTISLPIVGQDADGDQVRLTGRALNFDMDEVGAAFNDISGPGVPGVTSNFIWPIPCDFDVSEQDIYSMEFTIEDIDACQLTNTDTLRIDLIVNPLTNNPPQISLSSLNDIELFNEDSINLITNETGALRFTILDLEGDSVSFEIINIEPEIGGFEFDRTEGRGQFSADFLWTPRCNVFSDDQYNEDVIFTFRALDKNCASPMLSEYQLKVHIEDIDAGVESFLPPNMFTPGNGDVYNDFFGMYKEENGELVNILPFDNCAGEFEKVVILNRWGNTVFESEDREFKWFGRDLPSGVYFYYIKFSNQNFKGSVTLIH